MTRRLLPVYLSLALTFALAAQPARAQDIAVAAPYRLYLAVVSRDGQPGSSPASVAAGLPSLGAFTDSVAAGAAAVRGVYVESVLALPVVQQPADDPVYVSAQPDTLTQFGMAAWYGVTGLLAHNYAAGRLFFEMEVGDAVTVVYGDGRVKRYQVSALLRYQALQPDSPMSDFIDLATGQQSSAGEVFMRVYAGGEHVTFQTCIASGSQGNWGRLFVIAEPAP